MPEQTSLMSLKCLVLDDSVIYAEAIKQMLASEPGIEIINSHTSFGEGVRAAKKHKPDIVLLAGDTPGVSSIVESLDSSVPEIPIIVLFSSEEPDLARECILAGAQLCLYSLDDRNELVSSIRRLVARERRRRTQIVAQATGDQPRLARVLTFHSAKGGSGTTTMVVNTAISLAQFTKKRVVIVDAALQSADVGVLLDLDHPTNIADLMPHMKELDEDLLSEIMATHSSGVKVLLAPSQIERSELITEEQFLRIIGVLRKAADYVLIDTPHILDAVSMAALDTCDQIVVVSTPEVAALRNTARFLQLTSRLGYPQEKIFLLINRAGSKGAVNLDDIKKHIKYEIGATIPSGGKKMISATNTGVPVTMEKGKSSMAKAFITLATKLSEGELESRRKRTAKIISWIRIGRKQEKPNPAVVQNT